MAIGRWLIVFDVNGVLLKSYNQPPLKMLVLHLSAEFVYCLGQELWCAVRLDAEDVLVKASCSVDQPSPGRRVMLPFQLLISQIGNAS
ncbi:hypothetical protein GOP47_0004752 [Adiantum capillus-veneris]|uniref:Uncharacterized protein n=1 Tax=Adiantum capillus-veneris TaxID=13818 RepID=A0A9D4V422_ADICA|nr:hypothetical protein GOP47_0004752 [Adiantum capillus-veneris]